MIASNTQRPTGRPFEHLNFGSAPVKGFDQVGVPTSRLEGGRFHNPEVIPARVRRIDLNDDLGPAVAIDVADADGSTGVRQAGAVKNPPQANCRSATCGASFPLWDRIS